MMEILGLAVLTAVVYGGIALIIWVGNRGR